MKNDPLEQVAQELWKKVGLAWNKIDVPDPNGVHWYVRAEFSKGVLECKEEPNLGEHDYSTGPVELCYSLNEENSARLNLRSKYVGCSDENKGKAVLGCGVPSAKYLEFVGLIKDSGAIGEKLLRQQRAGNPDIVSGVSWRLNLEKLEGLEDFIYNFITGASSIIGPAT